MKKLVVLVDLQKDFVTGSLGTPEAQAIIPKVIEKIKQYHAEGAKFLATLDTHDENYLETQEGKKLPVPHCIGDTEDWKLDGQISQCLCDLKIQPHFVVKNTFGKSGLGDIVKEMGYEDKTDNEIILMGLCTDICVISNGVILKSDLLCAEVSVVEDCCAGVTPESHQKAIDIMRGLQINII